METIGIIIGVLVILILIALLTTYLMFVFSARKIKNKAEKFLAEKGIETAVKFGEKYLKKK